MRIREAYSLFNKSVYNLPPSLKEIKTGKICKFTKENHI